jgi:hypothetical protein
MNIRNFWFKKRQHRNSQSALAADIYPASNNDNTLIYICIYLPIHVSIHIEEDENTKLMTDAPLHSMTELKLTNVYENYVKAL